MFTALQCFDGYLTTFESLEAKTVTKTVSCSSIVCCINKNINFHNGYNGSTRGRNAIKELTVQTSRSIVVEEVPELDRVETVPIENSVESPTSPGCKESPPKSTSSTLIICTTSV